MNRTSSDLAIRPATSADTSAILGLMKSSLGEGSIPRDEAYWNWKHHSNPFGLSPILLAEADGTLVGLRVFMRWEWQCGLKTYRAVRAVDTATHPQWQGKGIFKKLTLALVEQVREDGVAFVFNTPNDQSRPGYLKMGWASVGRSDLWIRPLRPLRIARTVMRRGAAPAAADAARSLDTPLEHRADEVTSAAPFAVLLGDVAAGQGTLRLRTPGTPEYFAWRYAEVPGFTYHALADFDEAHGAAVFFRYKRRGALTELRVCDIIYCSDGRSRRTAAALLSRLRKTGGADYISAMASSARDRYLLLSAGFIPAPRTGPILTVLPLVTSAGSIDPLRRSSWAASIGDLELF
jgi:GNAT superfamily N-acetyltransferase